MYNNKKNKKNNYYKKQGISLVIVTTALVIMATLILVASLVGSNAIKSANFDDYISKIKRVSDDVNIYYTQNNELPIKDNLQKTNIVTYSALDNQLKNVLIKNNDNTNTLYVVNMGLLEDSTIDIGRGDISNQDVFLVAEDTHNVYYLKGFKYNGKMYYSVEN